MPKHLLLKLHWKQFHHCDHWSQVLKGPMNSHAINLMCQIVNVEVIS